MKKSFELIVHAVGVGVIVVLLLGWPLQLLWNWLMPILFNLPHITFWQAVGLNILSDILFRTNVNVNK